VEGHDQKNFPARSVPPSLLRRTGASPLSDSFWRHCTPYTLNSSLRPRGRPTSCNDNENNKHIIKVFCQYRSKISPEQILSRTSLQGLDSYVPAGHPTLQPVCAISAATRALIHLIITLLLLLLLLLRSKYKSDINIHTHKTQAYKHTRRK